MNILPYKLSTTNDKLTSHAGLLSIALLMKQLDLSKHLDTVFSSPKSNRAIATSSYFETLVLMQHQGLFHLDDEKHLHENQALSQILGMNHIPKAFTFMAAIFHIIRTMFFSSLNNFVSRKVYV